MYHIFALISVVLVSLLDNHLSTFFLSLMVFGICAMSASIGCNPKTTNGCKKVLGIVFPIYIVLAYITSLSFLDGRYYYVVDAANDFVKFDVNSWSSVYFWEDISRCYFDFADNNALFDRCMEWLGYWANSSLDGVTPFFLTLPLTLFGVLSAITFFQILSDRYEESDATKYAISFALLSFFLLYSCFIIRDIIIAYFYLVGFKIVLRKLQYKDIYNLIICLIITMGIRLYSGLFFGVFIAFWLYKILSNKKGFSKVLLILVACVAVFFISSSILTSILVDRTSEELNTYNELSTSGGSAHLSNKLYQLPSGISHVALIAFSQTRIDSFNFIQSANTFSHFSIGVLYCISSFWWFIIFWGLMYFLFVKKEIGNLDINNRLLLGMSFVFLAANTAHIDIRRMMYVFPYLYLLYLSISQHYSKDYRRIINRTLFLSILSIAILYLVIGN